MTLNISQADIAELIGSVVKIEEKWKGKNSKSINLIQSMAWDSNTREEAHSRILADLLKINFIKESFMNELLKDFGGFDNCDSYEVKPEDGKIDVRLYSKTEKKIIIIENKINAATEQPNQIARYVMDVANRQKGVEFKDIFVVYLNPDTHSLPSVQSLTLNGKNMFNSVSREQFKVLSYKDDITCWLKEIKNRKEAQEEPLLLSALEQYIYYLEVKFKNTDMDREIKSAIDTILHLDNMDAKGKFDVVKSIVDNQRPDFNKSLSEYKSELAIETVDQWKEDMQLAHSNIMLNTDEDHKIDVQLSGFADTWFLITPSRNGDYTPSWLFWDNAKDDEERKADKEKCKEILKAIGLACDADPETDGCEILHGVIPDGVSGSDLCVKVYEAAKTMD